MEAMAMNGFLVVCSVPNQMCRMQNVNPGVIGCYARPPFLLGIIKPLSIQHTMFKKPPQTKTSAAIKK